MATQIFKDYYEFSKREDKKVNGVDSAHTEEYPNYEEDNVSNEGCWNCLRCSGCSGCSGCSDCSGCYSKKNAAPMEAGLPQAGQIMGNYPIVENIHQKVYEAANTPKGLNMNTFHSCETTHCRAGWAIHLAGEKGYELERHTNSVFAAMMIFQASSPSVEVAPVRFFEDNKTALEDMKRCAELEAAATK